jgi:hypothetical protein
MGPHFDGINIHDDYTLHGVAVPEPLPQPAEPAVPTSPEPAAFLPAEIRDLPNIEFQPRLRRSA